MLSARRIYIAPYGDEVFEKQFSIVQILMSAFLDSIGRENFGAQLRYSIWNFTCLSLTKNTFIMKVHSKVLHLKRKYKNRNIIQKPDIQQQEKKT